MLRANRYALAASLEGELLQPWERALHGCDNPFLGGFSVLRRLSAVAHDTGHRNEQSGSVLSPNNGEMTPDW